MLRFLKTECLRNSGLRTQVASKYGFIVGNDENKITDKMCAIIAENPSLFEGCSDVSSATMAFEVYLNNVPSVVPKDTIAQALLHDEECHEKLCKLFNVPAVLLLDIYFDLIEVIQPWADKCKSTKELMSLIECVFAGYGYLKTRK